LSHYQTCKIISEALNPTNNFITNLIQEKNQNLNNYNNFINSQSNFTVDNSAILNSNINNNYKENEVNTVNNKNAKDLNSDFSNFMDTIEFKNINLDNFLKIILFNLGKINHNLDSKIDSLQEEVKIVKSDIKQINREINLNLTNLNTNIESEIDALNDRISMLNISLHPNNDMKKFVEDGFKNISDKIERKTSNDGSFIYGHNAKSDSNENLSTEILVSANSSANNSKIIKNNFDISLFKESKFSTNLNNNISKIKNNTLTNSKSSTNTGKPDSAKPRNRIELGKKFTKINSTSTEKPKINKAVNFNNSRNILNTSINREALSPKNRSPTRTTILNDNNSRSVRFEVSKNKNTVKDTNLVKIRERSSHHFCASSGNAYYPIQTSYEAIQATLRNHELIIESLNKILGKIDTELAKDTNIDKCFNLLLNQFASENKIIKASDF
jgi:hypothetical protein